MYGAVAKGTVYAVWCSYIAKKYSEIEFANLIHSIDERTMFVLFLQE